MEIRKLLDVEDISWNRSITLPPREQKGITVLLPYLMLLGIISSSYFWDSNFTFVFAFLLLL